MRNKWDVVQVWVQLVFRPHLLLRPVGPCQYTRAKYCSSYGPASTAGYAARVLWNMHAYPAVLWIYCILDGFPMLFLCILRLLFELSHSHFSAFLHQLAWFMCALYRRPECRSLNSTRLNSLFHVMCAWTSALGPATRNWCRPMPRCDCGRLYIYDSFFGKCKEFWRCS